MPVKKSRGFRMTAAPARASLDEVGPDVDYEQATAEAIRLLQDLIRVDTTNPPGNEAAAAHLLAQVLVEGGFAPEVIESAPDRANVVCRMKGSGELPPLLLFSHLDVVSAEGSKWTHPPFAAQIADGYVWGRGSLDIKNHTAASVAVLKLLKREGVRLKRDVILAAVADEEVACQLGSKFLVDQHPEKVRAEYGFGELGGITMYLADSCFYLIGVAEKGWAHLRMTCRGAPGHGAVAAGGSAVTRLAEAVVRIGAQGLPHHMIPTVDRFLSCIQNALSYPKKLFVPMMRRQAMAKFLIEHNIPKRELALTFSAMLANTAAPTILNAGHKYNIVPSEASAELDCRLLPGQTANDLLRELRDLVGPDKEFEVLDYLPPTESSLGSPALEVIDQVLNRHHPGAIPIPYLNPGGTDAKYFSMLGTQCYGFTPIRFDRADRADYSKLIHGHDERLPLSGFKFGLPVLHQVVRQLAT
jgi:acetylornithine deacetylase/succinyl-diaminopimelate desuccinylase-like protein